jgi:hypothetical protein
LAPKSSSIDDTSTAYNTLLSKKHLEIATKGDLINPSPSAHHIIISHSIGHPGDPSGALSADPISFAISEGMTGDFSGALSAEPYKGYLADISRTSAATFNSIIDIFTRHSPSGDHTPESALVEQFNTPSLTSGPMRFSQSEGQAGGSSGALSADPHIARSFLESQTEMISNTSRMSVLTFSSIIDISTRHPPNHFLSKSHDFLSGEHTPEPAPEEQIKNQPSSAVHYMSLLQSSGQAGDSSGVYSADPIRSSQCGQQAGDSSVALSTDPQTATSFLESHREKILIYCIRMPQMSSNISGPGQETAMICSQANILRSPLLTSRTTFQNRFFPRQLPKKAVGILKISRIFHSLLRMLPL